MESNPRTAQSPISTTHCRPATAPAASKQRPCTCLPGSPLQGDPFDPASLTLVYSWGAKGAFATQEEAKAAFLDALKQVQAPPRPHPHPHPPCSHRPLGCPRAACCQHVPLS